MVGYITIIILALALLMLSIRHLAVKQQIRNVNKQLRENAPRRRSVSIGYIDRDIEALTLAINNLIGEYNQTLLDVEKNHQYLKGSIADISHDMRTPLTSTIGYLQLIARGSLDSTQSQYVDIAIKKSQYLRKLLDDFFELSVFSCNDAEIELEKVDLASVVSEVILDNENEFAQRKITPIFEAADIPAFICGNMEMLQRVVQNLISNCLQYSCGNVIFTVYANDSIILTIENPVSDINNVDVRRIFDRFYKCDSSRNGQRTGLGLSIAQLLVDKMGGSISAYAKSGVIVMQLKFNIFKHY